MFVWHCDRNVDEGARQGSSRRSGSGFFCFQDIVFGGVARQQAPPLIRQVGQAALRPQPQGNLNAAHGKTQYPITL